MDWIIKDCGFSVEDIDYYANKFLIGNGYMGIRASLDEYSAEERACINLAGIYDRNGDTWRETVNAPNGLWISLSVNGRVIALPHTDAVEHEQWVDIKNALQGRKTVWQLEEGKLTVTSERFASMNNFHRLLVKYTVETDFDAKIEVLSGIDANIWDISNKHFAEMKLYESQGVIIAEGVTVENAIKVKVCQTAKCNVAKCDEIFVSKEQIAHKFCYKAQKGVKAEFEKQVYVSTSLDNDGAYDFTECSYSVEFKEHSNKWEEIWQKSLVTIEGDDEAMFALNYSLYHLNVVAPRHRDDLSIAARGLSSQVYKGAIFWDTEMFMFDYFLFTQPEIARKFLKYRVNSLKGSLVKAKEYGFDGAYYAWESQEEGYDACSEYNVIDVFTGRPVRTYFRDKQVHVSAAIIFALMEYIDVTGDRSLLYEGGAKMVIECAKFYYSMLLKKPCNDYFEIHDVVGPDEYHERVNNNAYTNKMAQFVFKKAAELIEKSKNEGFYENLSLEYNLKDLHSKFSLAAEKLFVPGPDENNLIEQFDRYFKLEDASLEEVRSRLLDEREYWGGANGVASHTQINKQADVVAMLSIFANEYSTEVIRKNWEYYMPRTEHGSSLSACMFATAACHIGKPDEAYPMFMKSATADLTRGGKLWAGLLFIGGTHPAASGGAWKVAVQGFSGISVKNGEIIKRKPYLPKNWKSISYKMQVGDKWYFVKSTNEDTTLEEIKVD